MAAHNYDGDVLTDELAQVHMSPGFITSNLVGVDANGTLIKAGHGPSRPRVRPRVRPRARPLSSTRPLVMYNSGTS